MDDLTWAALYVVLEFVGIVAALEALLWTRTSQGAVAWGLSLICLPFFAVPLYLVFGRARFRGYRELTREFIEANRDEVTGWRRSEVYHSLPQNLPVAPVLEEISSSKFLGGNSLRLLIDAEETFREIVSSIGAARKYAILQFYILRGDRIGQEVKRALIAARNRGVEVYVLYDELGSGDLDDAYIDELRGAGVEIYPFDTTQGFANQFQLNFRNHRKLVIVDGEVGYIGGYNVGDEYLGRNKLIGEWRDTQLQLQGPAVLQLQGSFLADWYWATRKPLELNWEVALQSGGAEVLVLRTGPVDPNDRCSLSFHALFQSARSRLWIASPYFVPDDSIVQSLQIAAYSGVDVRILLPEQPDHLFVWLASRYYIPLVQAAGVRVFHYQRGFLHEKALLVDDRIAAVGSVNLDNRSFRLNFEITAIVAGEPFNREVEQMFEEDFRHCIEESPGVGGRDSLYLKIGARFARLFAPIL